MVISENNKKIIYSLLVFPFPVTGIPILVYILPFYASNYNLGLSLVGLIFFAGRIIDVFTDPIMGALVDRYPSRFGKHKHWIFLSLPVLCLSAYFLFFPHDEFISGWYLFIALFTLLCISMCLGSAKMDLLPNALGPFSQRPWKILTISLFCNKSIISSCDTLVAVESYSSAREFISSSL